MKLDVEKSEFLKGLQWVQSIVEKRNTMPILANVLLEAEGDLLHLMATDLEVAIKGSCKVEKIEHTGSITVSARKLYEIIRELPDTVIRVEKDEQNQGIKISCDRIFFYLMGMSSEEFPSFPSYEGIAFVSIPNNILKEMIEKTIFAVSQEETRLSLNGIFMENPDKNERMLRMVATDGHRLSMIDRDIEEPLHIRKHTIIPRKGFYELRRLLEEKEGSIEIGFLENSCVVRKRDIVMVIRLIDAEFPDYKEVIPTQNEKKIKLERKRLLESLRRVSLLSTERYRGVRFEIEKNLLKLSSNNPDFGEAEERIDVEYLGSALTIGFNARYFVDVLAVLSSEMVTIELNDEMNPAIIRPLDDEKYLGLIMPMRL